VLRQPLEDKIVTISRAAGTLTFPANFMLVAAMNPCPCGYYGDPTKECTCAPSMVTRYQRRTSEAGNSNSPRGRFIARLRRGGERRCTQRRNRPGASGRGDPPSADPEGKSVVEKLTLQDLETVRVSPRDGQSFTLEHTAIHVGHIQIMRQMWDHHALRQF